MKRTLKRSGKATGRRKEVAVLRKCPLAVEEVLLTTFQREAPPPFSTRATFLLFLLYQIPQNSFQLVFESQRESLTLASPNTFSNSLRYAHPPSLGATLTRSVPPN